MSGTPIYQLRLKSMALVCTGIGCLTADTINSDLTERGRGQR